MAMRAITAVVVAGVLLACGSDSKSNGGSSSGTSIALSGSPNITGTLNQATAIIVNNKACNPGTGTVTAAAAVLVFSTLSNACELLQQQRDPANTTAASIVLARIGTPQTVTIGTGGYTFFDVNSGGLPPFDLATQTASMVVAGGAVKNGGSAGVGQGCLPVETTEVNGGSVTVSSVTSTAIAGTADVTLANGGAIKGNFNASICSTGANIEAGCDVTGITLGGAGTTCQ
jgi:hypothetical protein